MEAKEGMKMQPPLGIQRDYKQHEQNDQLVSIKESTNDSQKVSSSSSIVRQRIASFERLPYRSRGLTIYSYRDIRV